MKRFLLTLPAVLLSLGTSLPTQAQSEQDDKVQQRPCDLGAAAMVEATQPQEIKRITSFIPAEPIKRIDPKYPVNAARKGYEGWVRMSYVINEEGKVEDPIVEDFAGDSNFKKQALRAIKAWRFSPAMKDGKPTQTCHESVQFDFILGGTGGATNKFIREYKKAKALIEEAKVQEADDLVAGLHKRPMHNRYETAWLHALDAEIARIKGDDSREYRSISRTLSTSRLGSRSKPIFPADYILSLYQSKLNYELKSTRFSRALASIEAMEKLPNIESSMAMLSEAKAQVMSLIASDEHFSIAMSIGEQGSTFHRLARRQFSFLDLRDKVETVEVRCESHREKFTVAENNTWMIPESWGQCNVLITGEEGASFTLVEVADEALSSADAS